MAEWNVVSTPNGDYEAKQTDNVLMMREVGQTKNYPHSTVSIVDGEPDFSTFHHSDPDNTGRFGQREVVMAALRVLRGS